MDVQICKPFEPKFKNDGRYGLYQFVSIVAREKLENGKARLVQSQTSNN